MTQDNAMPKKWIGSIWITCNQGGYAACPHCEALSWHSGTQWRGSCKHVVGPGTDEKHKPAMIFTGENTDGNTV